MKIKKSWQKNNKEVEMDTFMHAMNKNESNCIVCDVQTHSVCVQTGKKSRIENEKIALPLPRI